MSERRRPRHNPYQLPLDYGAQPLDIGQHVRVLHEPYLISDPTAAARYLLTEVFAPFEAFKQEHLYVLLLNNKLGITHDVLVYIGTVNSTIVRVAELFMEAVKVNAPSIILSHNHPSGMSADPSPEDLRVTQLAYEAGQLLQVDVIDHIIVAKNKWCSLKSQGLVFPKP